MSREESLGKRLDTKEVAAWGWGAHLCPWNPVSYLNSWSAKPLTSFLRGPDT